MNDFMQNGLPRWEELIALYLDGQATETEKEELFQALADNPHLRETFEQSKMLDSLLQSHSHSLSPMNTPNKKEALLAHLNLPMDLPSGSVPSFVSNPSISAVVNPSSTRLIVSSVATFFAILLFLWWWEFRPSEKNVTSEYEHSKDIAKNNNSNVYSSQFNNSITQSQIRDSKIIAERTTRADKAISRVLARQNAVVANLESNFATDTVSSPMPFSPFSASESSELADSLNVEYIQQSIAAVDIPANLGKKWHISAYGRLLAGVTTVPNSNFSNAFTPFGNNMAIGFRLNFDEQNALGLEIGQESQPLLVFEESATAPTLYESLTWYSIHYRHTFGTVADSPWQPFAEIHAGITRSGSMSRLLLGYRFFASEQLSFNVSAEGTLLAYRFEGKINTVQKLNIGIGVDYVIFR